MNCMRVSLYTLFLTLVLTLQVANAAPSTSGTLDTTPYTPGEISADPDAKRLGTYHATLALGFSSGALLEVNEVITSPLLLINFREKKMETLELDLIMNQENLVGVFPGIRYPWSEDSVQKSYIKLSTGMYLAAKEGFTNFIAIRRLQVRGSFGYDNLFDLDHRLRAEVGLGASLVGFEALASLGWTFHF